ncbi:MAG: metabolite traffic protein EboE, partial [Planctomycetota bacterium]
DDRRLAYTLRLASIFTDLLPNEEAATISTLPLGWPVDTYEDQFLAACVFNLRKLAEGLADLKERSGKKIVVCIEPEPGCIFDRAEDVVRFFENRLLTGNKETDSRILEHIGVCHDVCHSSVMFESQDLAIKTYAGAGIQVGKVQVSSAVEVDFRNCDQEELLLKKEQLRRFAEPRYLHQTSVRQDDGEILFYEDLHLALEAGPVSGLWRVHFHVPVFVQSFEHINTTQQDIFFLMSAMQEYQPETTDFEVETYAWNVMPHDLQAESVSESIAAELKWFQELID